MFEVQVRSLPKLLWELPLLHPIRQVNKYRLSSLFAVFLSAKFCQTAKLDYNYLGPTTFVYRNHDIFIITVKIHVVKKSVCTKKEYKICSVIAVNWLYL